MLNLICEYNFIRKGGLILNRKRGTVSVVWLLAFVLLLSSILIPHSSAQAATKKAKLNVKKLNMTIGNEFRLRVYNLKKRRRVTYTSSNENVVSIKNVTPKGKCATISTLSIGTAVINATVYNSKTNKIVRRLKCRVRVSPNAFSIKFTRRKIHMNVSERFHLEYIIKPNASTEQPVFECDNPEIASVSCHGVVTALSPGKATITATLLSSGITATCTVEIHGQPPDNSGYPAKDKKTY